MIPFLISFVIILLVGIFIGNRENPEAIIVAISFVIGMFMLLTAAVLALGCLIKQVTGW